MDPAHTAPGIDDVLRAELDALAASGLYRERRPVVAKREGPRVTLEDGAEFLSFCGNDYLGLHDHPSVKAAAVEAVERWGTGATASRLITGSLQVHRELEEALVRFTGAGAATVFPSGFQANLGLVGALAGPADVVFSDARNHASLIEACRASRATVRVFRHADADHLEQLLRGAPQGGRRLVLTDAVFSMTGGVAPIPELLAACERHGAWLCVDEAHSTGVLGETGRGVVEHFALEPGSIPARVVTFGKALGGQGAAVVGGAALADAVRNRARAYVYTTALAPASAAAAHAALEQIAVGPERVRALRSRSVAARTALSEAGAAVGEAPTPIIPVVVGSPERAMALAAALQAHGVLVVGIRPPTVPDGEAGLRLTVSTTHTQQDLEQLGTAIRAALAATAGLGQNESNTRRQP
jgi:8-amino-7-oxononanoate synthase